MTTRSGETKRGGEMGEWIRWLLGGLLGTTMGAAGVWMTLSERVALAEQRLVTFEQALGSHVSNEMDSREHMRSQDAAQDTALTRLGSDFDYMKDRINEFLTRRR